MKDPRQAAEVPQFAGWAHADKFLRVMRAAASGRRSRYPMTVRVVATNSRFRLSRDGDELRIHDVRTGELLVRAGQRAKRCRWALLHASVRGAPR